MILPTKHVSVGRSMLGLGGLVLQTLTQPMTASALWDALRSHPDVVRYDRFVLALDLLYAIEALDMKDGVLHRRTK